MFNFNFGLINVICTIPWWVFLAVPALIIGIIVGFLWYMHHFG